jgi:AraC-like DNA-binding protein
VAPAPDVTWLTRVQEVRHPISQNRPLWVRHTNLRSGPPPPQPSVPHPERHPYCELNFHFTGQCDQLIGAEKIKKAPGDLMLMGPGTPHYAMYRDYPQRSITIHFLPTLLFEMGPEGDGARVLARFTAPQTIRDRVIRLPRILRQTLSEKFELMAMEFGSHELGFELRLRALLMETLVDFLRWEKRTGRSAHLKSTSINWAQIEKTLRYIHENYSEPLYVKQIARTSGLSPARLQSVFQEALGMSCVQYLRTYRISHAAALLASPEARVTEVAFAVGFETFSHFNTSFRSLMGMSPTEYIRSRHQNRS